MTDTIYTPPRLRLIASYQAASTGSVEQVEIELNDDSVPITSSFVGDLLTRLLASGNANQVQVGTTTWTPQTSTAGGSFTFTNPNGGTTQ